MKWNNTELAMRGKCESEGRDMEFEIKTDLSRLPDTLATNLSDVKRWVMAQTEKYDHIVLDESQTAWAKADIAKLRKLARAIDESRLDVKRQWMRPYNDFDAQCKEIQAILDAKISGMDAQVKAFDNAKREAKKAELQVFFAQQAKEAQQFIEFSDVFDPKWLNATTTLDKAKSEMEESLARYREDVRALDEMCAKLSSSGAFALREKYRESKSLHVAMSFFNRMLEVETQNEHSPHKETGRQENGETWEMVFRVHGTPEQFMKLKTFLRQIGMTYEKV